MEEAEKISNAFASLIPQLFFDVIARIVPGFVITAIMLVTISPLKKTLGNTYIENEMFINHHFIFIIVLFIAVIYTISVVFYGIWATVMLILFSLLSLCDNEKNTEKENLTDSTKQDGEMKHCRSSCLHAIRHFFHGIFVEVVEACPEFSFRHDYIKLNAPTAGGRITKLKAEIHMSGALTAAFIINSGLGLFFLKPTWEVMLSLLASFGCFFSNRHFTKRLHRSVNSYSVLLDYPENTYTYPYYRVHTKGSLHDCNTEQESQSDMENDNVENNSRLGGHL